MSIVLFSACQESAETPEIDAATNPFEREWDTPFGVPPFNEIKNDHFMPAFQKGMEENLAEIDAIVNNPEAPTFENTLE